MAAPTRPLPSLTRCLHLSSKVLSSLREGCVAVAEGQTAKRAERQRAAKQPGPDRREGTRPKLSSDPIINGLAIYDDE